MSGSKHKQEQHKNKQTVIPTMNDMIPKMSSQSFVWDPNKNNKKEMLKSFWSVGVAAAIESMIAAQKRGSYRSLLRRSLQDDRVCLFLDSVSEHGMTDF